MAEFAVGKLVSIIRKPSAVVFASRLIRALAKLLVFAAVIIILVVVLTRGFDLNAKKNYKTRHSKEIDTVRTPRTEHRLYNRTGKVVLLYSNQRSGSSFVGEFLNKNKDSFYLFEPLFPFGLYCNIMTEHSLRALVNMSKCDFRLIPSWYRKANDLYNYGDTHSKCVDRNICFCENHRVIFENYLTLFLRVITGVTKLNPNHEVIFNLRTSADAKQSHILQEQACSAPLDIGVVSALCSASRLVAYKILRICSLSKLELVYRELTEMGNEVFVIHLVRDPRAIINSNLHEALNRVAVENRLEFLCGRLKNNLDHVDSQFRENKLRPGIVQDGRYLRVRHEDISENPLKAAEDIYRFIGLELPTEVSKWLEESAIDPVGSIKAYKDIIIAKSTTDEEREKAAIKLQQLQHDLGSKFGTVRNSSSIINKWRMLLDMDIVDVIQRTCSEVMVRLGYRLVHSVEELRNLQIKLY